MKINAIMLFLFIGIHAFNSNANEPSEKENIRSNFPKLEEVLSYLNDEVAYICEKCMYGVAKKKDGYFLTMTSFESRAIEDEVPIWSSATNAFVKIPQGKFNKLKIPRNEYSADFNSIYGEKDKFDLLLVYGYDNWQTDLIELIEDSSNELSAEDHEMLARAYNRIALELFPSQRSYAKISAEKKQEAWKNFDLSISHLLEIKAIDPNYQPLIISDIDQKIGHEYMNAYIMFSSIKEYSLAEGFLNKVWYTPAQIQSAKNWLAGCPENGFLFTHGDTDTYPLLYIQKKLDYRSDVKVLNLSLLYSPWYVEMNKQLHKYNSTFNGKNYGALSTKPQFIDEKIAAAPFKQWLAKEVIEEEDTSTIEANYIPASFIINFHGTNLPVKSTKRTYDANLLVALDLIASNPTDNFSFTTLYIIYKMGFTENYLSRGKTYQITEKTSTNHSDVESINQVEDLISSINLSFIESLGRSGLHELSTATHFIDNLGVNFNAERISFTNDLAAQFPISDLIKLENFDLTETLNSFYESNLPESSKLIKRQLKTIAVDRIQSISAINKSFDQDISDLENLFSIYAGALPRLINSSNANVADEDKEIMQLISNKVDQLLESPILENRKWSHARIKVIKIGFEHIDLN